MLIQNLPLGVSCALCLGAHKNLPEFSDHFWLAKIGVQSEMANALLLVFTSESPSLSPSNVG